MTDHTPDTPLTPSARRDLTAALAKGVAADLDAAALARDLAENIKASDPFPFGPTGLQQDHRAAVRMQGAQVLGELLYAASLIAMGLRTDGQGRGMNYLHLGLDRVRNSPVIRHLAECPGEHQSATTDKEETGT